MEANKCPECNKELKIDDAVFLNAEAYGNPVLAKSKCCGIGFIVKRKISFDVALYVGTKEEDDWGRKFKKII